MGSSSPTAIPFFFGLFFLRFYFLGAFFPHLFFRNDYNKISKFQKYNKKKEKQQLTGSQSVW